MRAYLSIKMDRPIISGIHYISPGGYEVTANGKTYCFDFNESYGSIDKNDSSIIHFELRDEDYSTFPEIMELRRNLRKITMINEVYMYTGELNDPEIYPVKLLNFTIEDINSNGKIIQVELPVDTFIF